MDFRSVAGNRYGPNLSGCVLPEVRPQTLQELCLKKICEVYWLKLPRGVRYLKVVDHKNNLDISLQELEKARPSTLIERISDEEAVITFAQGMQLRKVSKRGRMRRRKGQTGGNCVDL